MNIIGWFKNRRNQNCGSNPNIYGFGTNNQKMKERVSPHSSVLVHKRRPICSLGPFSRRHRWGLGPSPHDLSVTLYYCFPHSRCMIYLISAISIWLLNPFLREFCNFCSLTDDPIFWKSCFDWCNIYILLCKGTWWELGLSARFACARELDILANRRRRHNEQREDSLHARYFQARTRTRSRALSRVLGLWSCIGYKLSNRLRVEAGTFPWS
jgi:hypothetical protein